MRKPSKVAINELARDLDESVDPAGLSALTEWLDSYTVPSPPPPATEALIGQLRAYVPSAPRRRFREGGLEPWSLWGYMSHLWASARMLRWPWWAATTLVTAVGLLIAPYLGGQGLPLVLLAPPLVSAGVAHAFRASGAGSRALELSCAVHPSALILSRLLLVVGWVLGLGGLAALVLEGWSGQALPMLAAWAGASIFSGGVTLCLTYWAGPRAALIGALTLWLGAAILGVHSGFELPLGDSAFMLAVALAAVGCLLTVIGLRAGARLGNGLRG